MGSFGASMIAFDQFRDTDTIKAKAWKNAEEGGPNSGFEIDNVEFFKQPELTDQFPEMADDIQLIVDAEAYVDRLVDFDRRMRQAKGMSRGMAYELQELVPDMESFSVNKFTETVSTIGWEASVEEVSIKLWAMIAAAIAVAISIIYKFFSWMFGGESSGGSVDEQVRAAEKGVDETKKKVKNTTQAIKEVDHIVDKVKNEKPVLTFPKVVDHDMIERSRMPEPLKEIIKKNTHPVSGSMAGMPTKADEIEVHFNLQDVLFNIDGGEMIYQNLINPSPEARLIYGERSDALDFLINSFDVFKTVAGRVASQIHALEDVLEDTTDNDEPTALTAKMRFAHNASQLGKTQSWEEAPLRVGAKSGAHREFTSPLNWAYELKAVVTNVGNMRGNFTSLDEMMKDYNRGFFRLSDVDFDVLKQLFEYIQQAQPLLKKLERVAGGMRAKDQFGMAGANSERADLIMKINRQFQQDVRALMIVYGIIGKVYQEVSKNGKNIMKALVHNAKAIVDAYTRFNKTPPDDLAYAYYKLQEQEKAWEENELRHRMLPETAWVSFDQVRVSGGDGTPEITMKTDSLRQIHEDLIKPAQEEVHKQDASQDLRDHMRSGVLERNK